MPASLTSPAFIRTTRPILTPHPIMFLRYLTFCYAVLLLPAFPPLRAAEPASSANKQDEPVMLSVFQVVDDPDEGYRSTQTTSGSRTLSNLRDTPNSISVLNRELLDDLM